MTSIIGYGDLIRSKKLSEEELILYSNAIVEEGKRLEKISMKLMDLTVLKQDTCTMSPIPTTLFFDQIQQGIQPPIRSTSYYSYYGYKPFYYLYRFRLNEDSTL